MMEEREREELNKRMQIIWVIRIAMVGSLVIYLVVCQLIGEKIKSTRGSSFPFVDLLKNVPALFFGEVSQGFSDLKLIHILLPKK